MKVKTVSCLLFTFLLKKCLCTSHLLVTRVGPCSSGPETLVKVSEMIVDSKSHEVFVTGQLNISQDINNGWSIKATMLKCHDIRNLDTCDFHKANSIVKDGCLSDNDDDTTMYSLFFSYIQPELSCPLKAGSYQFTEFPLMSVDSEDIVVESKISTSVFGYTYRLEGFDVEFDKIMCVDAYLQLKYDRDHNWLGERNPKPDIEDSPHRTDEANDHRDDEE